MRRRKASAPTSPQRARPACRWSSMRATPTTTWRRSSRRKQGRGPSPSSCIASRPAAGWPKTGVALGGYVSFSGILTFKNSPELRAIAADVPRDRLLVETDAPYLAPVPFRGKRNEPAYVANTATVLAETIGVSEAEDRRYHHATMSSACSPRCRARAAGEPERGRPAALHDPRLRLVARHAAHHRRLGQLRSGQSEEPAHAPRGAGRAHRGRMAAARAVVIDTGPDFREQMLLAGVKRRRRGRLHASACRPYPRHRRSARLRARAAAADRYPCRPARH